MQLSARDRLRLWEAAAGMHPVDAAIRTLAVARPDIADPAGLPLGERDAALLGVRAELLGDTLIARSSCPTCGEQTTLELSVAGLLPVAPVPASWTLDLAGRTVRLRPLTSRDAAAAARSSTRDQARATLVRAAVVEGAPEPDPASSEAIAASLAEHDAAAEITLSCACPACGETWTELLDVARFVAAEIVHSAGGLLSEVAELAGAYGWSEDAILAMSDARRRAYLALAAR